GAAPIPKKQRFMTFAVGRDECVGGRNHGGQAGLNELAVHFRAVLDITAKNVGRHMLLLPKDKSRVGSCPSQFDTRQALLCLPIALRSANIDALTREDMCVDVPSALEPLGK